MADIGTELTNSLDRGGRGGMTGPFGITDGSLAAPGLRFTSDTNNGLRRTGTDTWTLVAGGVDIAQINTAGLTLIGAAVLGGYLPLAGGTITGPLVIDLGAAAPLVLQLLSTGINGAAFRMRGNGATTPSKYLDVKDGDFHISSDAYGTIFTLTDAGILNLINTLNVVMNNTAAALHLSNSGANGAMLQMTGNGAVTPKKYLRAVGGTFQILNDAFTPILSLSDAGALLVGPAAGGGLLVVNRTDQAGEGGEIRLTRALDNASTWAIDVSGATADAVLRIYAINTSKIVFQGDPVTGQMNIPEGITQVKLARTAPGTSNVGSFDMNAANDFLCTPTGPITIDFTNRAVGQRGMIYLENAGAHAITFGAAIFKPATAAADLSIAGQYLISYWVVAGTSVFLSYSEDMQ
jgi:hypothetical protein